LILLMQQVVQGFADIVWQVVEEHALQSTS
jgi:hypothetical protein